MKTVEQIMDIISGYGHELKDYGHTESSGSTFNLIRTAIEELVVALEKEQSLTAHHRTVQLELMAELAAIKGEKV